MSTEPFYYDYMRIRDVKAFHKDFFADFDPDLFDRLLTFMELTPDLKVRALSSGMAAKLKIAVTLSRRAEVIMLDEPLNGIDLIGRDQIIHTIIQATGNGATFIISSHLFDELEPIVDNVVMMKGGKVILEGELKPSVRNTANPFQTCIGKFMRTLPYHSFKQKNRTIIPQRLQK